MPNKPGKPEVSQITKESARVLLKAPKSGPEVHGYFIEHKEKRPMKWIRVNAISTNRCDYQLKGETDFMILITLKYIPNVKHGKLLLNSTFVFTIPEPKDLSFL